MASVEQAFHLRDHEVRHVGGMRVVRFRDEVLELIDIAGKLDLETDDPASAVVVWGSGRRFAVLVEELVNQISIERFDMPRAAQGEFTDGIVYYEEQVVPILKLGALSGAYETDGEPGYDFTEMQQSALGEVANIGSGHAATALSGCSAGRWRSATRRRL